MILKPKTIKIDETKEVQEAKGQTETHQTQLERKTCGKMMEA
tara:strand:- start:68 stop:193 length:126 start_codon:yes stop_codon:yes gene_type:complete